MFDHGELACKISSAQKPDTVLLKPTNHVHVAPNSANHGVHPKSYLVLPSGKPEHKINISSLEN